MARITEVEIDYTKATVSSMTIPIDYDDNDVGSVGDPPDGTVFKTQDDVDKVLSDNGWTAFKHLDRAYEALPLFILHAVTFEVAAGIQRPSGDTSTCWDLTHRYLATGAGVFFAITIKGVGEYLDIVGDSGSPLTVDSYDNGSSSKNPSVSFTGTPFAGLNLKGRYAILSTGQKCVIHKHTDNTLYTLEAPTSAPTTCWVGRPSTIFRNSQDDIVKYGNTGIHLVGESSRNPSMFSLEDVSYEGFGSSSVHVQVAAPHFRATRVVVDDLSTYEEFGINPNGRPFQGGANWGLFNLFDCAYAAPDGVSGNDGVIYKTEGPIRITECYFAKDRKSVV